ncbi:MAG: ATP-dependent Clp protease proteolytic subunit [Actinomycetota bacterium]
MPSPWPPPDLPFPLPPGRHPRAPVPSAPPFAERGGGIVADGLVAQRRILVSGILDGGAATALAAQLIVFDGSSDDDVEVIVNSPGGPVGDVIPLLDVLDLMRARVNTTGIGSIGGTAVGLMAAATGERRAAPRARFSLRVDTTASIEGAADDIARRADELARQRARYLAVLAAATGHDEAVLAAEIDGGGGHTATEALSLGIVDVIAAGPGRRR